VEKGSVTEFCNDTKNCNLLDSQIIPLNYCC
jgi:hypothetical protein